jgi:hypothetical protein
MLVLSLLYYYFAAFSCLYSVFNIENGSAVYATFTTLKCFQYMSLRLPLSVTIVVLHGGSQLNLNYIQI